MTHVAFTARGHDVALDTDFVVVGSGAGGAMAALTLARAGQKVTLVEAGAWRDPDDYPHSTYGALRDLMDEWGSTVTMGRALWPIVQARTVGGTTVINSAICVRTPGDVFDHWKKDLGVDTADLSAGIWRYQDQVEKELWAQEVPPPSRGRSNDLAGLADKNLGYEGHVMTRYVKNCEGSGQCLQGCKRRNKQSTNITYIPEVLTRGGWLLSCAPVKKVVFEGTRAVGVAGRFQHPVTRKWGAQFSIRAKKGVIIAASATHSPALLLRSGVKLPALGRFFRAHPGTGVMGVYDQPVDMSVGATQGWATLKFRDSHRLKLETLSLPPEMVAGRLPGAGTQLMERLQDMRNMALWVLAVRAQTEGTVTNGWFDRPRVEYSMIRSDMERLRSGLSLVAKMHFAAGAKYIVPLVYGMPYRLGPDEVSLLEDAPLEPRSYVAILSHLFGGCVLGADARNSVCDVNGKVHNYQNLMIADASALPSTLGVNPQHTIMGLAGFWAERWANG